MQQVIQSKFVGHTNPWTGKMFKEVPIPQITKKKLGTTKYDDLFDDLMKMKKAIEVDHDLIQSLRRGWQRYVKNRNLKDVTYRSLTNRTGVTVWLEKQK